LLILLRLELSNYMCNCLVKLII